MRTFFENSGPKYINEIIEITQFTKKENFMNDRIFDVSTLESGKSGEIGFFENIKYSNHLKNSKLSYCFIREKDKNLINQKNTKAIISKEPLLDFILTVKLFYPNSDTDYWAPEKIYLEEEYKNKNNIIDRSAVLGKNFKIGYNSIIKNNVIIGDNVEIGSNCVISNSIIKNNVKINDGSIVGKIGYGFKYINNKFYFIPHIGLVEIHDNVYIGSNCTIDRGSFGNTVIGNSTMIDNLVHIAHNVNIGNYCNIAAQVGIAGSTKIGSNCMIGGQAGISGHLSIGNRVNIGGKSGVLKNLPDSYKVMGYPATSIKNFLRKYKYD